MKEDVKNKNQKIGERIAFAPYNFVSFPGQVLYRYEKGEELPGHDLLQAGKTALSGEISYCFSAETKVLLPRAGEVPYGLRGSTLRGLISDNTAILGMANPFRKIADKRYFFRSFNKKNTALREYYKETLGMTKVEEKRLLGKVKAGYFYQKKPGVYVILPAKEIFPMGEALYGYSTVRDSAVRGAFSKSNMKPNPFLFDGNEPNCFLYEDAAMTKRSRKFRPYYYHGVLAEPGEQEAVNLRFGRQGEGAALLCGSYAAGRMRHYLIAPPNEGAEELRVAAEDIQLYHADLASKSVSARDRLYNLLGPDEKGVFGRSSRSFRKKVGRRYMKPLFYIEQDGRLLFGMTPYIRLPYPYSIYDGIPEAFRKKESRVDYLEAIFGFSRKPDGSGRGLLSYQSRLSFTDAMADRPPGAEPVELIHLEPKPNSYQLYLKQPKEEGAYSSYLTEGFQLRGLKQYYLQKCVRRDRLEALKKEGHIPKEAVSYMKPYLPGTCFRGKIYFENLEPDELGLLLWALRPSKDEETPCYHSVGHGKAFGFGRLFVASLSVKLYDYDRFYESLGLSDAIYEGGSIEKWIGCYRDYVNEHYREALPRGIMEEASVKELLYFRTKLMDTEEERRISAYMNPREKGYANLWKLPSMDEIMDIYRDESL